MGCGENVADLLGRWTVERDLPRCGEDAMVGGEVEMDNLAYGVGAGIGAACCDDGGGVGGGDLGDGGCKDGLDGAEGGVGLPAVESMAVVLEFAS